MVIQDPSFYRKLLEVSSEVQMKPEDLLNVMAVESGIDPTAHNPNGNASGLLQFMPSTLKGLGFHGTHADFRNISSIDQLDYVKKLILNNMKYNGGPFTSAAQYYVANFLPVALQLPGIKRGDPRTIIVAQNPTHPHLPNVSLRMERIYYEANPALDANKDGMITYGDIQTVLNRASAGKNFRSAVAMLENSTGYQPSPMTPSKMPPSSMLAFREKPPITTHAPLSISNIMSVLDRYLQQVMASEKQNGGLYKQYLPEHTMLIRIATPDYAGAVEFAHVLATTLSEQLLATASINSDGQQVEIKCSIHGPKEKCYSAIEQISLIAATKQPSYQHQKFPLKFVRGS